MSNPKKSLNLFGKKDKKNVVDPFKKMKQNNSKQNSASKFEEAKEIVKPIEEPKAILKQTKLIYFRIVNCLMFEWK